MNNDVLEKGRRALDEGDLKAALQYFQEELNQRPSAEVWGLLAEAQVESGMSRKAHQSLSAGLKLDPDAEDLLYLLGDLLLEENRYEEAVATYQRIIDQTPDDAEAWVSQAMAYVNLGQLDTAEANCRKALELDAEEVFALNALGDIQLAKGRLETAADCFRQAVALEPEDPQAHLSLAEIYYDQNQSAQAEAYCLKGLELDPSLPAGYLTLGNIYLDQERIQEAIENYRQFLRLETSPVAKEIRDEVAAVIEGLTDH